MVDKKTVAQILGENLKRIRTEKGVSRKDLAAAIGVSEVNFGKYETGNILPSLDKILAAADFLKVSVASLTGENDYSDNTPNIEKLVEERFFNRRLQRAYQMARDFLDSMLNYEPNFDKEGRVVVHSPEKITYENGVVSYHDGYNSVAFKTKSDFVKVMEQAENDALRQQISFNQAFRQIVFNETPAE